jgi:hypothetical protein
MTSQRKINANRRNAAKSTGPRTAEGKARSSRNALKTGLYASGAVIRGENPVALQLLADQFTAEYHPVTPTERSLVDSLAHLEWMLRRFRWLETEIWRVAMNETPFEQKDVSLMGYAFVNLPDIAKVHRLRNAAQRNFNEVLDRLLRLRRISHEPVDPIPLSVASLAGLEPSPPAAQAPEPPPQPVAAEAASPEIGFVPSERPQQSSTPAGTAVVVPANGAGGPAETPVEPREDR